MPRIRGGNAKFAASAIHSRPRGWQITAISRIAQPRGGFDQRVEHRLQIEGRAADDLEHVAGRGLVFERFFEIAGALAQFAEQPRILHRDHRLRREILEQRDLLVRERPHLLAEDAE